MKHRLAAARDADRIIDILLTRAEWLDSKGIFQWPTNWLIQQEGQIRSDIEEDLYRVCVIDNEIFATYRLSQHPEEYWDDMVDAMYLAKLAVAQTHSGRKLGREIMKQIEKNSFAKCVRLDCVTGNAFLARFYQELGYRFIKTVSLPGIELDLYELKLGEHE